MQATTQHVTIATSSGAIWLALIIHFGTALIAIVAGVVALVVAKGGELHKRSGMLFTYAMITTAFFIIGISLYEGKSAGGGLLVIYLVLTATTTVKALPRYARGVDVAMMLLAFILAALMYWGGAIAWNSPGRMLGGAPAGMLFFLGTVTSLAAVGDVRMLRAGGISGPRRLARHIWRMCFSLFIATGSFFLGQMKFIPEPVRILPLMLLLGIAPLFVLLYWMWRVRLRRKLSGMIVGGRILGREPA